MAAEYASLVNKKEELDEALDEYWIFYDQLDEDGEQ